jgi:hypothetical protein
MDPRPRPAPECAFIARFASREQRVIDAVAHNELLRLRGERFRLGVERRGLGLGQQGPDLLEHVVVGSHAVVLSNR